MSYVVRIVSADRIVASICSYYGFFYFPDEKHKEYNYAESGRRINHVFSKHLHIDIYAVRQKGESYVV